MSLLYIVSSKWNFSGIFFILDSENRLNLLGTKGNCFSFFGRDVSL